MAKNPMQRKAQNSFLLGVVVTLLITSVIIGFLILQLTKMTKQKQEEEENMKTVYILNTDLNSGDVITEDMLDMKTLNGDIAPSNAISSDALSKMINVENEDGMLIKKAKVISKINLKQGTVLTADMIKEEGTLNADERRMEYNVILLPSQIEDGKYIDVRLRLPNGKDFIVVSHKKIELAVVDGVESLNNMYLNLSETEILTLSCAIVEAYKMDGSKLYAAEYVEPGLQGAATETYLPDDATMDLISKNPNCLVEAKNAIITRYNNTKTKDAVRKQIKNSISDDWRDNVTEKVTEEIEKMQEERQNYLDSLGA